MQWQHYINFIFCRCIPLPLLHTISLSLKHIHLLSLSHPSSSFSTVQSEGFQKYLDFRTLSSACLSACLSLHSLYLTISLSVCPSLCLCPAICLSVCLSLFLFFSTVGFHEYLDRMDIYIQHFLHNTVTSYSAHCLFISHHDIDDGMTFLGSLECKLAMFPMEVIINNIWNVAWDIAFKISPDMDIDDQRCS